MVNPPPVSNAKKAGMGCFGCGCVILVILIVLFLGLVIGGAYVAYNDAMKITSPTPANIPTFDGGDDVYNSAQQKLTAFNHDTQNHLAATIHLTADEINTLIARNPNFSKNKILVYVTLTNDQARVQSSLPSDLVSDGMMKNRFLNSDVTFGVNFDADTKLINLDWKNVQAGPMTVPEDSLAAVQAGTSPALNAILQKNPDFKNFINQASSIQIKNSELVIETK